MAKYNYKGTAQNNSVFGSQSAVKLLCLYYESLNYSLNQFVQEIDYGQSAVVLGNTLAAVVTILFIYLLVL